MQGENGFVKDYRSTIDWEWFTDVNTAHVWEYIRLRANYEPSRFRGMMIGRGEMLESLQTMAAKTGLTVQNVRTALEHLELTGEITRQSTRYGTFIKVVKYAQFQDMQDDINTPINTPTNKEVTTNQQGSNKEVTTYKEYKKERTEEIKKEREAPTLDEVKEFVKEEKLTINPERFFSFYESQNWKTTAGSSIRDWKAKARSWQNTERRQQRKEILPEFYNADPIRDKNPQLASKEEIERVRAMLMKGAGGKSQ